MEKRVTPFPATFPERRKHAAGFERYVRAEMSFTQLWNFLPWLFSRPLTELCCSSKSHGLNCIIDIGHIHAPGETNGSSVRAGSTLSYSQKWCKKSQCVVMFCCPSAGKNLPGAGARLSSKDLFLLMYIMQTGWNHDLIKSKGKRDISLDSA